jgi:polyisoprenyl-teichoic acid--peptidoglycan teichoic acid transferase
MFDHLDDERVFRPDEAFRSSAVRRGRALRRRRRAAAGLTACGCTLFLGIGGAAWWGDEQLDRIDRVDVAEDSLAPPATAPGEPTNFLVVGVDEPRLPNEPTGATDGSPRADAILVVRAGTDGRLSVLSVPRDLWVDDGGQSGRINAARQDGGPSNLIQVVSDTLGIPVHHYVELDFAGVQSLVDAVGGVPLEFSAPIRDEQVGFLVASPGCHTLDGSQVLALARSRHLLVGTPGGGWESDPTGDLGRTARQRVLAAAAARAIVDLEANPGDLQALVDAFVDHAAIDDGLENDELLDWARWMVSRGDQNLTEYALPVEAGMEGSAAVLHLAEGWEQTVAEFMAGQPPTASSAPAAAGTGTGTGTGSPPQPVVPTLCD